jgi:hypothetical protein
VVILRDTLFAAAAVLVGVVADPLQADNASAVTAATARPVSVFAAFIGYSLCSVAGDVGPVKFDAVVNQQ